MNFNTIGKTLVFFNLIVSLLAMTWGAGIFLQQLDWGWKEPRKELGARIPSEYDKRALVLNIVYDGYLKVKPALQPARDNLDKARVMLAPNHLLYVQKLEELDGRFKLTDTSLASWQREGVPEAMINALKDGEFTQRQFLRAFDTHFEKNKLPPFKNAEELDRFKERILNHAELINNPLKVLRLDYVKGILKLSGDAKTDPDRLNPPEFGRVVNGREGGPRENDPIVKSYKGYFEELEKLRGSDNTLAPAVIGIADRMSRSGTSRDAFLQAFLLSEHDKKLTERLIGSVEKDKKGEVIDETPGLYELQEIEKRLQDQYKAEMEYLRPIRELAVNDATRFLVQKADLEEKLMEIKNRKKKK